jgi:hypothetical protein
MTAPEGESDLVVAESHAIEPSAEGARNALETYQQIQKVFDEKMPDAIMEIEGKKFRKKAYWRGIAVAFQVECKIVSVDLVRIDEDWGYEAIVRATTNDGRSSDGDGACMASEKTRRDGTPTKMQTVHNIRSHAVTRAKNRAISDLVGFGEVSADELPSESTVSFDDIVRGRTVTIHADAGDVPRAESRPARGKAASEKQLKLLYAKSLARANVLLDDALAAKITPKIQGDKELRSHIAKIAAERVGSGEVILGKEIDPLLAAIECIQFNEDGDTVYAGVVNE